MEFRVERDTLGEMKVPADKFWAASDTTKQRKLSNRYGKNATGNYLCFCHFKEKRCQGK